MSVFEIITQSVCNLFIAGKKKVVTGTHAPVVADATAASVQVRTDFVCLVLSLLIIKLHGVSRNQTHVAFFK